MAKARKVKGVVCESPAIEGIKLVLSERFDEMRSLRKAALNWKDPEGVHSMRVASRRLRSAIRDFEPFVNKQGLTPSVKKIRDIADALGEVRDQDVAIIELGKLTAHAPSGVSAAVKSLISERKKVRRTARRDLKKIIFKDELKDLGSEFAKALESATEPRTRGRAKPPVSYVNMAKAVIDERLKELEKLSDNLYKPFEVEPLHEMRIAAKRLRYAIELFQQCCDPAVIPVAKNAAHLQSALGTVHDCDVWIDSFGDEIIKARKMKNQEQTEAFSWLLTHFLEVRDGQLQQAFSYWSNWEAEKLSEKLRETLAPKESSSTEQVEST